MTDQHAATPDEVAAGEPSTGGVRRARAAIGRAVRSTLPTRSGGEVHRGNRAVPEATVARLADLPEGAVHARGAGRGHRLVRGAGRRRRGQLGEPAQGPVPPRLLRDPRRRVRRRRAGRADREHPRADPPARGRPGRGRKPRPRAGRVRRLRHPRLPHRGAARRRPRAGSASRSPGWSSGTSTSCPTVVGELDIAIGVIATPARAAQEVCDLLVDCGVTSILNFAPTVLVVPDGVDVRKVDLADRAADPVLPRAAQGS